LPRKTRIKAACEVTVYWDDEEQKKIYFEDKIQHIFVQEFEKRLVAIETFINGKGKLLDVGCGVGHFLATAKKWGWTVQGMDISRAAQTAAREAYGLEVEVATLENSSLERGSFDALTLWDVIEHIRRPIENLKAANRLLRMGGVLAMKTPNESSLFKQFALFCYRLLGNRAAFLLKYVYYVPHYFSYSEGTMSVLLDKCGFRPIKYETDETPEEFATEKINVHYQKDPRRSKVIALLPIANFFAKLFGKQNKIIVYAQKVREVPG
jgi:2-polyprenyl-3-methyl-5-hydroxy-6-metoxy-1,4-benzoquinol methylase